MVFRERNRTAGAGSIRTGSVFAFRGKACKTARRMSASDVGTVRTRS
jgi:hypothetical protein